MSVEVMTWVFKQAPRDLNPSEMLVALVLADHCNSDGGLAYPSVKRICERTRLAERTVQTAIQKLIKKGVLRVEYESNGPRPTVYCFPIFRGETPADPAGVAKPLTPAKNDSLPPQILRKNEPTPIKETVIEPSISPPPPQGVRSKPKTMINRRELLDAITDEEWYALRDELGVSDDWMNRNFEIMVDHYVAEGRPQADWKARWRAWMRKETTMKGRR